MFWKIDWDDIVFKLITVLIFSTLFYFGVSKIEEYIQRDLEYKENLKIYYSFSIKIVTNQSLESFQEKFEEDSFKNNLLKFDKDDKLIGGYFLGENSQYNLKNNTKIIQKENSLNFTLENGNEINGEYNIYDIKILLDENKNPVLDKTIEKLEKEFGDDLRIRDLEYIEIKSKSNTNKLFIFWWLK